MYHTRSAAESTCWSVNIHRRKHDVQSRAQWLTVANERMHQRTKQASSQVATSSWTENAVDDLSYCRPSLYWETDPRYERKDRKSGRLARLEGSTNQVTSNNPRHGGGASKS